jgi:glutathione S-transferase
MGQSFKGDLRLSQNSGRKKQTVPDIILHHYPQSPVSEKIRVVLGIKGLDWRSVEIPRLPPKPDLMPLTGGYRLTPVMQIGADIFCDSLCIARAIQERHPEPTLYPGGGDGMAWGVSRWTDGLFFQTILEVVFGAEHAGMPPEFLRDRGEIYFGPGWSMERLEAELANSIARLRAQFGWVEERLATGRKFMLGDAPGLPDALAWYLTWFIRGRWKGGPDFLSQFPNLCAWEERVAAIGHGNPADMAAAKALETARAAEPATPETPDPGDPRGLKPGDAVRVTPDNGGFAVEGQVLSLRRHEIAIAREDERVGRVAVHFPTVGYRVEID